MLSEDMNKNAKIKFNNLEIQFSKMNSNGREGLKSKYKPSKNKLRISKDCKEINCKKLKIRELNKHC